MQRQTPTTTTSPWIHIEAVLHTEVQHGIIFQKSLQKTVGIPKFGTRMQVQGWAATNGDYKDEFCQLMEIDLMTMVMMSQYIVIELNEGAKRRKNWIDTTL